MSSASRLRAYSVLKRIGKGSYGEVYLVAAVGDAKKQVSLADKDVIVIPSSLSVNRSML